MRIIYRQTDRCYSDKKKIAETLTKNACNQKEEGSKPETCVEQYHWEMFQTNGAANGELKSTYLNYVVNANVKGFSVVDPIDLLMRKR